MWLRECFRHNGDIEIVLDIIMSQKYEFDVEWWLRKWLRYNCDLESVLDIIMSQKYGFDVEWWLRIKLDIVVTQLVSLT